MIRKYLAPLVLSGVLSTLILPGCTTYQRRPIDIGSDLATWRGLDADDQRVRARADADGVAWSPADGLDLAEATTLALVLNPTARAARLQANAVAAGAGLAGLWPDPALNVEVLRALGTGSSPWIASGGLTLTVPLSGRLSAEKDGALATASAARFAAIGVEHTLRVAVARAWFDLAQTAERVQLFSRYVQTLDPMLARAQDRASVGEIAIQQLGILQIEAETSRVELMQSQAEAQRRRTQLLTLMGLTAAAKVSLTPDFVVANPPTEPPPGWPEDQIGIRQQLAQYEAGEQAVRREVARQYPDLALTPTLESDRGQTSIGLGLGLIPFPVFNLNRRGIAEARGRREVLRARVDEAVQQLVSETQQTQILAVAADARVQALQGLATRIDEQLARVVTLAEHGELDVLILRQVLQSGLQNRLAVVQARHERALTNARLVLLYTVAPQASEPKTDAAGDAR